MSKTILNFIDFYDADEIQKPFVKALLKSAGIPESIEYNVQNAAFDLNQRLAIQYISMASLAFASLRNSYANKKITAPILPQFRHLFDLLKLSDASSLKFIDNAIKKNEKLLSDITLKDKLEKNYNNFCSAITSQYSNANPDLVKFTEEVLGIKNFAVVEFNKLFEQFLMDVITSQGRCVPADICTEDQYIQGFGAITNVAFSESMAPLMKEWEAHVTQSSKFARSLIFEINHNPVVKNQIKKMLG